MYINVTDAIRLQRSGAMDTTTAAGGVASALRLGGDSERERADVSTRAHRAEPPLSVYAELVLNCCIMGYFLQTGLRGVTLHIKLGCCPIHQLISHQH